MKEINWDKIKGPNQDEINKLQIVNVQSHQRDFLLSCAKEYVGEDFWTMLTLNASKQSCRKLAQTNSSVSAWSNLGYPTPLWKGDQFCRRSYRSFVDNHPQTQCSYIPFILKHADVSWSEGSGMKQRMRGFYHCNGLGFIILQRY